MAFSSIEFLLYFLPIFFIFYAITPDKFKNITLLFGSLVFYAQGETRHFVLLIVSVCVNYVLGLYLGKYGEQSSFDNGQLNNGAEKRNEKRKLLMAAAVIGNVGVLLLFKAISSKVGLPLGISFYTFQILSYLFDVYHGRIQREQSLLRFATYITMFPKLISGPIATYEQVETELVQRKISTSKLQDGMQVFTLGLIAKVLLADKIGILWHEVQVTGFASISTPLAWLAALAYSMQIYFDFYGYSLMAIGLGRMLGFELPENFRTPYMARSVRDFYRRWHMTLGQWFSRYVYIPLGGSRRGEQRTILNLLVVWLLTSFWHGSTANFFAWGLLLWLCIVMERQLEKRGLTQKLKVLPHLYLWCVIPISWMCFAIVDMQQLLVYLGRMFHLTEGVNVRSGDWLSALSDYGVLLLVAILACTPYLQKLYRKCRKYLPTKIILAVLFWVCVQRLIVAGNNTFMYFKF